ncbi:hypothetical protein BCR42DRAFT_410418 [Absidia repens]|uniref:Uncharacterized protein n=1 Tax=Absidia repens TaxID=90262 RepID=A0A1X2IP09_9FUNG|nr:hypothetical protein BCR42DRAFT_410418 [Absidia repens]
MTMTTQTSFNSTPILLQPPNITSSSLTMMDDHTNQHTTTEQDILANMYYVSSSTYGSQYSLQQNDGDDDDDEDMIMPVPQHLDSEQINYEFPLRSHLKALAYLDQLQEEYSFFDETSFTSLTNDSSSSSSSTSFLSGYFDHHQQENTSITTPLDNINYSTFFSTLTDEKEDDLDLTRIHHHHMLTQHHHQQQTFHQTSSSSYNNQSHHGIQEGERSASSLDTTSASVVVDDNRLSPLQLPAQAAHLLQREQSYESTSTITKNAMVAPQSFLATPAYKTNNVDPSAFVQPSSIHAHSRLNSLESVDLPIIISETEPIQEQDNDDGSSLTSDDLYPPQRVVIIRLNKRNKQFDRRCPTSLTHLASDEGYDDEDQDGGKLGGHGCEIESASVFLPLDELDDDEEDYDNLVAPPPAPRSVTGGGLWTNIQQQQQWTQRIEQLERQVDEERAMRQAFEKAMEDMTVLMDQQQKVLYDRLEQEINMRQAYEHKMQQTLAHVEPLECRLEKETASRIQLEETMVHVLDQLELLHSQHHQHVNDDTILHNRMQKKLDKALDGISELSTATTPAPPTSATPSHQKNAISTNPSKHHASASSVSSVTNTTMSSRTTTDRMKPAARSNATSFNHAAGAAAASGTTANTNPPRSRTTVTASSAASTTTNKPKNSIMPASASVSRRSKFPNNKNNNKSISRSTKTPTVKNGGGGNGSGPDSHSSSRRLVFHR